MPADDGAMTDEDSGEENHVDISNIPSTQLTAFASIKSSQLQDDTNEGVMKQEKRKKIKLRQWKAEDLPEKVNATRYPYKPSAADIPRKPSAIFELFMDVVAIEHLVKQTVTYAVIYNYNYNYYPFIFFNK